MRCAAIRSSHRFEGRFPARRLPAATINSRRRYVAVEGTQPLKLRSGVPSGRERLGRDRIARRAGLAVCHGDRPQPDRQNRRMLPLKLDVLGRGYSTRRCGRAMLASIPRANPMMFKSSKARWVKRSTKDRDNLCETSCF